jgi:hypothetical protein
MINDTVEIRGNSGVRPECVDADLEVCLSWPETPPSTVFVSPPSNPIQPVVVVSSGTSVSECDPFVFDISTSSGSCGRIWSKREVLVESDDSTGASKLNELFSEWTGLRLVVPQSYLRVGSRYNFQISLCNFFNSCGRSVHVVEVTRAGVPVIDVVSSRNVTMKSSQQLVIRTSSSLSRCSSTAASLNTTNLKYLWSISTTDGHVLDFPSVSSNPQIFRLPSNSLHSSSSYLVTVSVSDDVSTSAPVTVLVNVVAPTLVASISDGRDSYFLKLGSTLLLDGSSTSFDDGSSISHVSPSWSCSRVLPASSSCSDLTLIVDSNGWVIMVGVRNSSASSFLEGPVFVLTLTATSLTQVSVASITIQVIQPVDPDLRLLSSRSRINTADILQLQGQVVLVVPGNVSWTSNKLDLARILPPPSFKDPGTYRYNIVIPRHTLSGALPEYKFTLSCGKFSVSVGVEVNTPPLIGIFEVDPLFGVTLDTVFLLTTSYCDDPDLPLTYQFGYLNSIGQSLTTRIRSEKSSSEQIFPAGDPESNHRLFTMVTVFDSLSSSSSRLFNISVAPRNHSSSLGAPEARSKLETLGASGGVDNLRNVLSAISSMVTRKSCLTAPDCRSLNREECGLVENTCGSCQSSFVGQTGSANTPCVLPDDLDQLPASCASAVDCNPVETCNLSTKKCERASQECHQACSGHGTCSFLNIDRGTPQSECRIGDSTCSPVCVCDAGYGGKGCEFNPSSFEEEKATMDVLMASLSTLVAQDDSTEENVLSWQSNLDQFTRDPSVLSRDASSLAVQLTSDILSSASSSSLSSDQLIGTVSSMDSVISEYPELFGSCEDSINYLASVTASSTLKGNEVESVNSNFRYTSAVRSFSEDPDLELLVPGINSNQPMNSIRISPNPAASSRRLRSASAADLVTNTDLNLFLIQFRTGLFSADSLKANPLRVYLPAGGDGVILYGNITFTFHNNEAESYPTFDAGLIFNTTCESGIIKQETFACDTGHGVLQPVVLEHDCVGLSEVLSSKCPLVRTVPSCQVMAGDAVCSVESFDSLFTICTCQLLKPPSRKLEAVTSMSLQVVSSLSFVSDGFVETISTPLDLNSGGDLKKVFIVIILYGVLWVGGLGLILVSAYRSSRGQKSVRNGNKTSFLKSDNHLRVVQDRLVKYLNATLPAVYQNQGWISRMMSELRKHHRYFVLFSSHKEDSASIRRRALTGIQLLTVQTMLMFLLAMACDLQFPTNDGTCEGHETKATCLSRRSRVDSSRSYCSWHQQSEDGGHCKYAETTFDIDAVIIVSLVVAILTAPINFVVDFLFVDILSAQSIDQNKANRAKSRLQLNHAFSHLSRAAGTLFSRTPMVPMKQGGPGDHQQAVPPASFNRHTVKIPSETSSAQSLALELASDLVGNTQRRLKMLNEGREQSRSQHLVEREKMNLVRKRTVIERSLGITRKHGRSSSTVVGDDELLTLFSSFVVDLSDQRKALKANRRERFDVRWGVDPTGEFSRRWTTLGPVNNEKILRDEMQFVRSETEKKIKKLEIASDSHIGVELMHLFMLDVLGRDTPAAKIFLTKSQQDFSHSYVLPEYVKVVAWIVVVILNLFFVYFSLVRAMQRGYSWQILYAMACLLQFLVEVFFYETSEALLLHFIVPDLVRVEVQSATFTLLKAIDQMCQHDSPNVVLNAPGYFFVSTNVAKRFPHLLESVLIQSYRTYWPGELGKKWKFDQQPSWSLFGFALGTGHSSAAARSLTLSAILTSILQNLGATAPSIQKMILHSAQPLLVTVVFMFGQVMTTNPLYSLLLLPVAGYGVYLYLTREPDDEDPNEKLSEIHPIPEQLSARQPSRLPPSRTTPEHESEPKKLVELAGAESDVSPSGFSSEEGDMPSDMESKSESDGSARWDFHHQFFVDVSMDSSSSQGVPGDSSSSGSLENPRSCSRNSSLLSLGAASEFSYCQEEISFDPNSEPPPVSSLCSDSGSHGDSCSEKV